MDPKPSVDHLLDCLGELPPMPQVAQKALLLLRDPDSSMAQLASVLAMDEALAGLALRWANSAYYGLKFPVSTVQQAVTILGQRVLHSLILAASLATLLERPYPGYGLGRGDLWRHSLGVAAGARLVASSFGSQVAEEAYHAGLLCDIGKLAFEILLREVDLTAPEWQGQSFSDLEKAHFGVDHATLGAEMARRWNLPSRLVEAIAYHHRPSEAGGSEAGGSEAGGSEAGGSEASGRVLADAVHIADAAMMTLGVSIGYDGLQYAFDPKACQRMGWNEARLGEFVNQIIPFIEETDRFIRLRRI